MDKNENRKKISLLVLIELIFMLYFILFTPYDPSQYTIVNNKSIGNGRSLVIHDNNIIQIGNDINYFDYSLNLINTLNLSNFPYIMESSKYYVDNSNLYVMKNNNISKYTFIGNYIDYEETISFDDEIVDFKVSQGVIIAISKLNIYIYNDTFYEDKSITEIFQTSGVNFYFTSINILQKNNQVYVYIVSGIKSIVIMELSTLAYWLDDSIDGKLFLVFSNDDRLLFVEFIYENNLGMTEVKESIIYSYLVDDDGELGILTRKIKISGELSDITFSEDSQSFILTNKKVTFKQKVVYSYSRLYYFGFPFYKRINNTYVDILLLNQSNAVILLNNNIMLIKFSINNFYHYNLFYIFSILAASYNIMLYYYFLRIPLMILINDKMLKFKLIQFGANDITEYFKLQVEDIETPKIKRKHWLFHKLYNFTLKYKLIQFNSNNIDQYHKIRSYGFKSKEEYRLQKIKEKTK
ncbi:MAG: hypothetical protein OEY49_18060 [Candidatus Heimdallarchaeota archaeon]|nr:hypothetical protein [Candidatus Heimdallarchaeota archaeon]